MGEVWRFRQPAAGSVTAWWLLRYIRRRQRALRAGWYRLAPEEVETELVAIAERLLEAVPVVLPGRLRPLAVLGHPDGERAAEGLDGFAASAAAPDAGDGQRQKHGASAAGDDRHSRLRRLERQGRRAADDLQRLVKWLELGERTSAARSWGLEKGW